MGVNMTIFFLVPVIAVFTKYDHFKRDVRFKLEDQGRDPTPALLNAEVEKVFEEQYLAKLRRSVPFVRLESENFVNRPTCATLISVAQGCTSMNKSVLSFLKRP
jgi:hypothetical protein